jgi:hypothetical protein
MFLPVWRQVWSSVLFFTPLPKERAPSTNWIGGWVDPRAGLINTEMLKFLTLPGLELRLLVVQPIASRYTDYATAAHWATLQ